MGPSRRRIRPFEYLVGCVALTVIATGCELRADDASAEATTSDIPKVEASSEIAAGRYLVIIGGCNDCHTEGYLQTEGDVPEEAWLAGSALGWRGAWGTTYPSNLRLLVQDMSEDGFVATLAERKALPPMPWMNVNQMSEVDARALYKYIRSLGAVGEKMPTPVPPDQEPETPYLSLEPVMPVGN